MSKPIFTAITDILTTDYVLASVANTPLNQLSSMVQATINYINASTTLAAYGITDSVVNTIFGRNGNVSSQLGDYSLSLVTDGLSTLSIGTGNGAATAFTLPAGWISGAAVYKSDWQGNQLQYATPRTNLLTNSNNFSAASWTNTNCTITAAATTGPDGTTSGTKLAVANVSNPNIQNNDYTVPSPAPANISCSVWLKAGNITQAILNSYQNGVGGVAANWVILSGPGAVSGSGVGTVTGLSTTQWTRVGFTTTGALTSGSQFNLYIKPQTATPAIGDYIYCAFSQMELGTVDTSYIATVGSTVTVTDYTLAGNQITFASAPANAAVLTALVGRSAVANAPGLYGVLAVDKYSRALIDFSQPGHVGLGSNGQFLGMTAGALQWQSAPVTSVFGRTNAVVATAGDYSIGQIGGVVISSPSSGQALVYNGTNWVNTTQASALGKVMYIGTWNASTNTPTLPAASSATGNYYITSVAGTYNSIGFNIGDWVISDGTNWDRVDGGAIEYGQLVNSNTWMGNQTYSATLSGAANSSPYLGFQAWTGSAINAHSIYETTSGVLHIQSSNGTGFFDLDQNLNLNWYCVQSGGAKNSPALYLQGWTGTATTWHSLCQTSSGNLNIANSTNNTAIYIDQYSDLMLSAYLSGTSSASPAIYFYSWNGTAYNANSFISDTNGTFYLRNTAGSDILTVSQAGVVTTTHNTLDDGGGGAAFASSVSSGPGGSGQAQLLPGSTTNAGYMNIMYPTGARQGYIGYGTVAQSAFTFVADTASYFSFNKPMTVTGMVTATSFTSSWFAKTANYTAIVGDSLIADTSGGAFTITLPPSPAIGNMVRIVDGGGTFAAHNLTIAGNGANIMGSSANLLMDTNYAAAYLVYYNSTRGWILAQP